MTFGTRTRALVALALVSTGARAADPAAVTGTWELASYVREEVGTGAVARPWGEKPGGVLMLLPDGRMSMVITAEGRVAAEHGDPAHDAAAAKLLSTVTAYAGRYTLDGEQLVFHVEVAWRPDWVGTDQRRTLKLEGGRMTLRTQPMRSSTTGKESVYVLTWRRAG